MFLQKIKLNNLDRVKWLPYALTIFLALVISWGMFAVVLQEMYNGKFFPRVKIGGINLAGMSYEEGVEVLQEKTDVLNKQGVIFKYGAKEATIYPMRLSATDPDLSVELYNLDIQDAADQAFAIGRGRGVLKDFFERITGVLAGWSVEVPVEFNEQEFEKILRKNFDEMLLPAEETKIIAGDGQFEVVAGVAGERIDYDFYLEKFRQQLAQLDFALIEMDKNFYEPQIAVIAAEQKLPLFEAVYERSGLFLKATMTDSWLKKPTSKVWPLSDGEFKKGLKIKWDENEGRVKIGFDEQLLGEILKPIRNEVEVVARDAKFKMENGKVVEFQASQDGLKIDFDKTLFELEKGLLDFEQNEFELQLEKQPARLTVADVNDLGLKELVAVGRSNFAGSPRNRIHNIRIGAAKINGLIIAEDEEFSLVEALGEISAATGYLPELVIKGNKTVPEYGGGLCQIATTAFRLALDAGVPILERKPHAYRVSYYEPAGTDATIYLPKPDLRFKNDFGSNLLLTTEVDGYDLIFRFWGTDDGRQVEVGQPVIYNIVSPGPTKYVETEDLEPGVTKCTESAHNGAEADLKQKIVYAGGEEKEIVWHSQYRPWQAVCLVGIDPSQKVASSTDKEIVE